MTLANLAWPLGLLLAACSSGYTPPPTSNTALPTTTATAPPNTTATAPAPVPGEPVETVLRLAKAELTVVEDETYVYVLAADGLFSVMGDDLGFLTVPTARLSPNGELRRLDGSLAGTITNDGAVVFDGKPTDLTIDKDGAVRGSATLLAIGPDGAASGALAAKARISYQGDADARRALLFGVLSTMATLAKQPPTAEVPAQAPRSTTIRECDTYRTAAEKARACPSLDATWRRRLDKGIARVNGFATSPPVEGADGAARSCMRATDRIKTTLATMCTP